MTVTFSIQQCGLDLETMLIPGGEALVGTDKPIFAMDGEGPLRRLTLAPFLMTTTAITNAQFAAFVAATGYETEAKRFGWSFVFRDAIINKTLIDSHVAALPWWCKVKGADWCCPRGPGQSPELSPDSSLEDKDYLPVVHVSWNDALAFASWAGGRLPSEAEWEHAARGDLADVLYPWGNAAPTADDPKCHFGQIHRPDLAPSQIGPVAAKAFSANGYGLFNMVGNVWEWTADTAISTSPPSKWLKGGSYMCHPKYCYRYRIAARIYNTVDTTLGHTGFRIVFAV